MHQNNVWKGFLIFVALAALWFSVESLYKLYKYVRLDASTVSESIQWDIEEIGYDRFAPHGNYTFVVDGKPFTGESLLQETTYRNGWVVQEWIAKHSLEPVKIWYSTSDPTHSALQKTFPTKECLSTALLWGLFLYFVGIGYYVGKYTDGKV